MAQLPYFTLCSECRHTCFDQTTVLVFFILQGTLNGIPSSILTHVLRIIYKSSQGTEVGHRLTETCRPSIQV